MGAGGGGGMKSSQDFIASFFDNVKDEGNFDDSVFDSMAQDEAPKSGKTFDELGLNPKYVFSFSFCFLFLFLFFFFVFFLLFVLLLFCFCWCVVLLFVVVCYLLL